MEPNQNAGPPSSPQPRKAMVIQPLHPEELKNYSVIPVPNSPTVPSSAASPTEAAPQPPSSGQIDIPPSTPVTPNNNGDSTPVLTTPQSVTPPPVSPPTPENVMPPPANSIAPNNSAQSSPERDGSDSYSRRSLLMSLLLVAILPAFAAVVIGFDGIPGIVTTCLLITPVVLAIMKRIKGILLAYAVGAGTVLAARTLIALIDGRVSYHGVRDQFPFLSSHTDTQAMISATIAASVLSIIVFVTVNYGTRVTKLVANIFFRSLAVWLLVFFSSTALFVIKNAEQQAQDKTYNETLAAYAQRNLDDSVPVYKIVLPDSYYQNSVQVDGAGPNYEEYFLRYRSNVNGYADVIIKVSQDKLPSSCKNTMTPQAQQDTASGTVFSCNIILATDDGKKVYGYRDLSDLDFRGFGPPKFTVQQLQQVSPERFYLQDGGSLVELYYDGLAYADPGLLDFSAVKNFASGLHEVDASARQDFINRYIKQSKQLKPVRSYMERDDHQAWIILAAAIAIYMALLFWALENIFEKAGHSYWEAYIPIVNLWVLVKIAGYPGWWSLITYLPTINNFGFAMMFATVIPFIAQLLFIVTILDIVLLIVVGLSIAGKFGRSKWFGILLIIPPLPGYLILGFDKSEYGDEFDRTVSTTGRNELNPPSVNA